MKLTMTAGNSKLGKVLNLSLPPGETCSPAARRACYVQGCYARKLERVYKSAGQAWANNLTLWREHPEVFEGILQARLTHDDAELFRWHVSGDIPGDAYFRMMKRVAASNPGTKFLCFTKKARYARQHTPDNLKMVLSLWPGVPLAAQDINLPAAYVRDVKNLDLRIPIDAKPCPGKCDTCGECWTLGPGESVVFDRH